MTLQEAKDQVAKKHGHVMWCATTHMDERRLFDEVAELYARSKWNDACEAQKQIDSDLLNKWEFGGRSQVNHFERAPEPPLA